MRIVAHRGVHRTLPENSAVAFEAAIALGADAVEFDVRVTRDRVPVVMHDLECEHYFDGLGGYVFERDLNELRAGPIKGWPGLRSYLPTFDEVLDGFAGRIGLEIELKDPSPELVAEVARSLRAVPQHWGTIELTSFEPAALTVAASLLPEVRTCLLAGSTRPWMTPPMLAHRTLGQARLAAVHAVHLHTSQLEPAVVGPLREAGLEIHAWDVNDEAEFGLASSSGATAIVTDEPERMLELRTRPA